MARARLVKQDLPDDIFEEFRGRTELALDCEMMGLNPVRDRLCVVQIAAEKGNCALIQVDEKAGAPRLKTLMENRDIQKIFHFARMDCLYLKTRLGIDVLNIYCTKIASKLARTYTDRHGLKELVREFAGEQMDKSSQSSDWGKEKLTEEQLAYAQDDVKYLFQLKRSLSEILAREGRMDFALRAFEFLPVRIELDRLGYSDIFEH